MPFEIRTRHGWGWELIDAKTSTVSSPIESAIAAQEVADALNAGKTSKEAFAKLENRNGRWYLKL